MVWECLANRPSGFDLGINSRACVPLSWLCMAGVAEIVFRIMGDPIKSG